MMNHAKVTTALLLSLLIASCSGCAGTAARNEVLLPAIRLAWPEIKSGAIREAVATAHPDALSAVADAERAINHSDNPEPSMAIVAWPLILDLARGDVIRRVQDGSIGPGVGESLHERIRRFEEAVNTYLRRN
jgi:hypothetical protein